MKYPSRLIASFALITPILSALINITVTASGCDIYGSGSFITGNGVSTYQYPNLRNPAEQSEVVFFIACYGGLSPSRLE